MPYKSVVEFMFDNEGWRYFAGSYEVVENLSAYNNNYLDFCGLEKEYKDVTFEDVKPLLDKIFDLTIDDVMKGIDQGDFEDENADGKLSYSVIFRNIYVCALDEYDDVDKHQSKRLLDRYERHALIDLNEKKVLTKDSIDETEDSYIINRVKGHFEILKNRKFFASADTYSEAEETIEEDKKETAMHRKNQTKDSVKIVSYDPGRYTGPWEGSYPASYELAAYSDRTDLEIDPDDVWMDPAGDYISFEEALNDIKENAVELKADDPEYAKVVEEEEWEKYGDDPADFKIMKVTLGGKQAILVTYKDEELGHDTDNLDSVLNALGYKQIDIYDIPLASLREEEPDDYEYYESLQDSKSKYLTEEDIDSCRQIKEITEERLKEGPVKIGQYEFVYDPSKEYGYDFYVANYDTLEALSNKSLDALKEAIKYQIYLDAKYRSDKIAREAGETLTDSKAKDINPINHQNEVKQKWIDELKDIEWLTKLFKYHKTYEIGPFEIDFDEDGFYAVDTNTGEAFGPYDRLYKLCDELIKNIKSNGDGFRRVYKHEEAPKNKFSIVKDSDKRPNDAPLFVCKQCLKEIESYEGPRNKLFVWVDKDDEEESTCDWCKESGFDGLYKILDSADQSYFYDSKKI